LNGEDGISLNDKDENLGKFIEGQLVRLGKFIGVELHEKFLDVFLNA
jgi:hypothetical protein